MEHQRDGNMQKGLSKKLNEADDENNTQSFTDRFNQADSMAEQDKVIVEYLVSQGIDEDEAESFVNINPNAIYKEATAYGVGDRNVCFQFLIKYYNVNQNIAPFTQMNKWNAIHNAVANHLFTDKQIAFTCSQEEQPHILLNPSVYEIQGVEDISWVFEAWQFLGNRENQDMNAYIINKYVRFLIANTTFNGQSMDDFDNYCKDVKINNNICFDRLRKAIIYSSNLQNFINEINTTKNQNGGNSVSKLNSIKNDFLTSLDRISINKGKIAPIQTISDQLKLLNQNVQEGDRDINGQYQSNQAIRQGGQADNRIQDQSTRNLINSLHQTFNTKDTQELIKQLENVVKLLRTPTINSQKELETYNQVYSSLQGLGYKDSTITNTLAGVDLSSGNASEIVRDILRTIS